MKKILPSIYLLLSAAILAVVSNGAAATSSLINSICSVTAGTCTEFFGYTSVAWYGAVPDARRLTDISVTSGQTAVNSLGAAKFTPADTGKIIDLYDYTNSNFVERGTFTYSSSTTGTISNAAGNSLVAANCYGWIGTDNSTAIQNAENAVAAHLLPANQGDNLAIGAGNERLLFPSNTTGSAYAFATPIVIDTNVYVDADAMLVPMIGSATTNTQGQANRQFVMVFMPGAGYLNKLQIEANFTAGIVMGTYNQQSHSISGDLTIWDVGGTNQSGSIATTAEDTAAGSGYAVGDTITLAGGTCSTEPVLTVRTITGSGATGPVGTAYVSNVGLCSVMPANPVSQGSTSGSGSGATFTLTTAPASQIGREVSGNDYKFGQYWVKGANICEDVNQANDFKIASFFPIGCSTTMRMVGSEEYQRAYEDSDTGSYAGDTIDSSHNIQLGEIQCFSLVSGTTQNYCVGLGQNDGSNPVKDITFRVSCQKSSTDCVRMGNVQDYNINILATNAPNYAGGGGNITNAINFTGAASPGGTGYINLVLGTEGAAITPKTGTGYGQLLMNGSSFYSEQAPTTGFSITIDSATPVLILKPSGTLATGAITMPANPMDGMVVEIASTQTITSLTQNANSGQTLQGALTTLAANTGARWKYQLSTATWYRLQ
jgi:hypothetical protein